MQTRYIDCFIYYRDLQNFISKSANSRSLLQLKAFSLLHRRSHVGTGNMCFVRERYSHFLNQVFDLWDNRGWKLFSFKKLCWIFFKNLNYKNFWFAFLAHFLQFFRLFLKKISTSCTSLISLNYQFRWIGQLISLTRKTFLKKGWRWIEWELSAT
jgi:hypothetical protein